MTTFRYIYLSGQIRHILLFSFMLLNACEEEPPAKPVGVRFLNERLTMVEGTTISTSLVLTSPPARDGSLQLRIETTEIPGQDYNISPAPVGGTLILNVNQGQREVRFSITVNDNTTIEIHDDIVFTLTSSSGGFVLLSPTSLRVSVIDNESPSPNFPPPFQPVVLAHFGAGANKISESDTEGLAIKVNLSTYVYDDYAGEIYQPIAATGEVSIRIASGHADYGKEFTTSPGTTENTILLRFTGTRTDTTLTLIPIDNADFTGSRFVSVTITRVTGGIQLGSGTMWVEIKDDEQGPDNVKWTKLNSPIPTDIQSVVFYDENNGYIVSNGRLVMTRDGGLTWAQVEPDLSPGYTYLKPHFISEEVGFVSAVMYNCDYYLYDCVIDPKIYTTTNGGSEWTMVKHFTQNEVISSLYFLSNTTGFIGTTQGEILKTIDGGVTWKSTKPGNSIAIQDLIVFGDGTGYARANDRILKTSNSGDTWSTSFVTPTNAGIMSLAGSSTETLYAIWEECSELPPGFKTIYKSYDGENWSLVGECAFRDIISFSETASLGASVGALYWDASPPSIHLSYDGGSSWVYQQLPEGLEGLTDVDVASDKVIYAVGNGGLILKGVVQ